MKSIGWRQEPKGPGQAFHMFKDAGGERVELLVHDCPASAAGPRMCGFEIYGRSKKNGPFDRQLASGNADNLEGAMLAAITMAMQPRETWVKVTA